MNVAVNENIKAKDVVQAAVKYLVRHGYKVLDVLNRDELETLNIVALDTKEDEIAFLNISYTTEITSINKVKEVPTREQCEEIAFKYFLENPYYCAVSFRFDVMRFVIMGENKDRAIVRHHRNAFVVA